MSERRNLRVTTALLAPTLLLGAISGCDAQRPAGSPPVADSSPLQPHDAGAATPSVAPARATIDAAAPALTPVASLKVGPRAGRILLDPRTHRVYVINANDAPDVSTSGGISTVAPSNRPGSVSVIDSRSRRVIATIALPPQATGAALDSATHSLWVVTSWRSSVTVIDTRTNRVTAGLRIPGGSPNAVAIDPSTHIVYISDRFKGVYALDGRTHKQLATVAIPEADDLAVDPSKHRLYVTDAGFGHLLTIDTRTRRIAGRTAIGSNAARITLDTGAHRILVEDAGRFDHGATPPSVVIVNADTGKVTGRVPLTSFATFALDGRKAGLYMTVMGSPTLWFLHGTRAMAIGSYERTTYPGDVAFDEGTRVLYVTNSASDTLTLFQR